MDRGEFLVVAGPNLGASSAGRSLGRFADLPGNRLLPDLDDPRQVEQLRAEARSARPGSLLLQEANHR